MMEALKAKLTALAPRERWMVLSASLMLLFFVLNTVLINPVKSKNRGIKQANAQSQEEVANLSAQIATIAQTPVNQQNQINQKKLNQLQADINKNQSQLSNLESSLVSPSQMPVVLENLMQSHHQVQLVAMKTLTPVPYLPQPTEVDSAVTAELDSDAPALYKHAFSITLAGNYLDLMHYAEALQQLSKQVLWDKATLKTIDYPSNELTLELYTLSLDKTWLSI